MYLKREVKIESKATEAVRYIMDLLIEKEMATKNVYSAMGEIEDMIIEYKDIVRKAQTAEQKLEKLKQIKGEVK